MAGLGPGVHYSSISSGQAGSPGSWGCPSRDAGRADAVKGVRTGRNLSVMTADSQVVGDLGFSWLHIF